MTYTSGLPLTCSGPVLAAAGGVRPGAAEEEETQRQSGDAWTP